MNYWDEHMGQVMNEAMSTPFDLVLGRKTYDIFAAYWPHAPEDAGAKPLNDATKYVASRSNPTLVEQVGPARRGCSGENHGAQEGRRARATSAREREPDSDAVAAQPGGPVPPVGLPPRDRVGQTIYSEGGTIPSGLRLIDAARSPLLES